jgi:hypothetical protein
LDLVFHLAESTDLRGIRDLLAPMLASMLPEPFNRLSPQNGFGLLVQKQLIIDEADGDSWAMCVSSLSPTPPSQYLRTLHSSLTMCM